MSTTLRNLLYTLSIPSGTNFPQEFSVFNTNTTTVSNGGRCCLWTVPAGSTWIHFEIWGGGGGGGGSCCCMGGRPGGSGAYSTFDVFSSTLTGCQYTICAGGTTGTSNTNEGCVGFTSFVTGFGLSNFCATGGSAGCTSCNTLQTQTNCCGLPLCCCAFGGDINDHGQQSQFISYPSCANSFQQYAMVAAKTVSGPAVGPGGCITGGFGCGFWFNNTIFPGGGGMSAQAHSGNCWCGMYGAGGLVSVTFG